MLTLTHFTGNFAAEAQKVKIFVFLAVKIMIGLRIVYKKMHQ